MPADPNDRFGLLDQLYLVPVTIPAGTSLSLVIDLGGAKFIGFLGPAAWTAAVLNLRGSLDGVSYYVLCQQAGTQIDIAVSAAVTPQKIVLFHNGLVDGPYQDFPLRYLQFRSGTDAIPVNQAAQRDFVLIASAPYRLPFR